MNLNKYIFDVNDFPKKGILFKDITPILNNPKAFKYVIDKFAHEIKKIKPNVIVAPEARGFLFAAPVAYKTKTRLVLVRKIEKLPRKTFNIKYEYEYDVNSISIHCDDIKNGDKIVIIDDVLATGETSLAISKLLENNFKINILGIFFILDIKKLNGIINLKKYYCKILI